MRDLHEERPDRILDCTIVYLQPFELRPLEASEWRASTGTIHSKGTKLLSLLRTTERKVIFKRIVLHDIVQWQTRVMVQSKRKMLRRKTYNV